MDINVILIVVMVYWEYTDGKAYQIAHFKYVHMWILP